MTVVFSAAAADDALPSVVTKDADTSEEHASYTIDDLAAVSKIPSRTIRFYQSKGVLPPPEKRGRVAFYDDGHRERLELIASLQDRGLRISAIRTLLGRIDSGEVDLAEWLGLEEQLTASWADDQPRTVSSEELLQLAGSDRAGLIGDLVRLGAVTRTGDVYLVRSPALLQVAMRLEAAGVDLDVAVAAEKVLRKHLGRAAKDLASHFTARAPDGDWTRLLEELRPTGTEAVRIIFGQEMERVLREWVESGKSTTLPVSRKKRTRKKEA